MTGGNHAEHVRVLVVDDHDESRKALAEVVVAAGFALVGSCASGEEALGEFAKLDPDLVLLDVRMPGLDGPTTARLMTAVKPEIAVVFVSATEPFPTDAETLGAVAMPKSELSPRTLSEAWLATFELLLR
jgi:CheY-like chemotaxis protein